MVAGHRLLASPSDGRRGRLEQRVIDGLLAATALHWAAQTASGPGGTSPVGLTLVGLDLTAALLFATRRPPESEAPFRDLWPCLGSVLLGGVSLKLAPAYSEWPLWAALLFALAGLGAILSLASLGGSFAVMPSRRALVQRGAYRLVRHPIYLAEATMLLSSALAALTAAALAVAVAALVFVVFRIRIEERLWQGDPDHAAYLSRVPWRLVPGLW